METHHVLEAAKDAGGLSKCYWSFFMLKCFLETQTEIICEACYATVVVACVYFRKSYLQTLSNFRFLGAE